MSSFFTHFQSFTDQIENTTLLKSAAFANSVHSVAVDSLSTSSTYVEELWSQNDKLIRELHELSVYNAELKQLLSKSEENQKISRVASQSRVQTYSSANLKSIRRRARFALVARMFRLWSLFTNSSVLQRQLHALEREHSILQEVTVDSKEKALIELDQRFTDVHNKLQLAMSELSCRDRGSVTPSRRSTCLTSYEGSPSIAAAEQMLRSDTSLLFLPSPFHNAVEDRVHDASTQAQMDSVEIEKLRISLNEVRRELTLRENQISQHNEPDLSRDFTRIKAQSIELLAAEESCARASFAKEYAERLGEVAFQFKSAETAWCHSLLSDALEHLERCEDSSRAAIVRKEQWKLRWHESVTVAVSISESLFQRSLLGRYLQRWSKAASLHRLDDAITTACSIATKRFADEFEQRANEQLLHQKQQYQERLRDTEEYYDEEIRRLSLQYKNELSEKSRYLSANALEMEELRSEACRIAQELVSACASSFFWRWLAGLERSRYQRTIVQLRHMPSSFSVLVRWLGDFDSFEQKKVEWCIDTFHRIFASNVVAVDLLQSELQSARVKCREAENSAVTSHLEIEETWKPRVISLEKKISEISDHCEAICFATESWNAKLSQEHSARTSQFVELAFLVKESAIEHLDLISPSLELMSEFYLIDVGSRLEELVVDLGSEMFKRMNFILARIADMESGLCRAENHVAASKDTIVSLRGKLKSRFDAALSSHERTISEWSHRLLEVQGKLADHASTEDRVRKALGHEIEHFLTLVTRNASARMSVFIEYTFSSVEVYEQSLRLVQDRAIAEVLHKCHDEISEMSEYHQFLEEHVVGLRDEVSSLRIRSEEKELQLRTLESRNEHDLLSASQNVSLLIHRHEKEIRSLAESLSNRAIASLLSNEEFTRAAIELFAHVLSSAHENGLMKLSSMNEIRSQLIVAQHACQLYAEKCGLLELELRDAEKLVADQQLELSRIRGCCDLLQATVTKNESLIDAIQVEKQSLDEDNKEKAKEIELLSEFLSKERITSAQLRQELSNSSSQRVQEVNLLRLDAIREREALEVEHSAEVNRTREQFSREKDLLALEHEKALEKLLSMNQEVIRSQMQLRDNAIDEMRKQQALRIEKLAEQHTRQLSGILENNERDRALLISRISILEANEVQLQQSLSQKEADDKKIRSAFWEPVLLSLRKKSLHCLLHVAFGRWRRLTLISGFKKDYRAMVESRDTLQNELNSIKKQRAHTEERKSKTFSTPMRSESSVSPVRGFSPSPGADQSRVSGESSRSYSSRAGDVSSSTPNFSKRANQNQHLENAQRRVDELVAAVDGIIAKSAELPAQSDAVLPTLEDF
jgi:hypothetical protein